jgi:glycine cleavage system H protein
MLVGEDENDHREDAGKTEAVNVPTDLQYTKSHEWVRLEGDVATIGITDHAQSELGDIVFVDLPTPGRALQAGDTFASVESVKTVSDVYSPVSGEVIEANEALGAQSELVNVDPYGSGWLVKVKVSAPPEGLLDAQAYKESLG